MTAKNPVKTFHVLTCSVRRLADVTERTRHKLTNTFLSIPARAAHRLLVHDDCMCSLEKPVYRKCSQAGMRMVSSYTRVSWYLYLW